MPVVAALRAGKVKGFASGFSDDGPGLLPKPNPLLEQLPKPLLELPLPKMLVFGSSFADGAVWNGFEGWELPNPFGADVDPKMLVVGAFACCPKKPPNGADGAAAVVSCGCS